MTLIRLLVVIERWGPDDILFEEFGHDVDTRHLLHQINYTNTYHTKELYIEACTPEEYMQKKEEYAITHLLICGKRTQKEMEKLRKKHLITFPPTLTFPAPNTFFKLGYKQSRQYADQLRKFLHGN